MKQKHLERLVEDLGMQVELKPLFDSNENINGIDTYQKFELAVLGCLEKYIGFNEKEQEVHVKISGDNLIKITAFYEGFTIAKLDEKGTIVEEKCISEGEMREELSDSKKWPNPVSFETRKIPVPKRAPLIRKKDGEYVSLKDFPNYAELFRDYYGLNAVQKSSFVIAKENKCTHQHICNKVSLVRELLKQRHKADIWYGTL